MPSSSLSKLPSLEPLRLRPLELREESDDLDRDDDDEDDDEEEDDDDRDDALLERDDLELASLRSTLLSPIELSEPRELRLLELEDERERDLDDLLSLEDELPWDDAEPSLAREPLSLESLSFPLSST